jgi:hypothetical protein
LIIQLHSKYYADAVSRRQETMMKTLLYVCAGLMMAFGTATARAADITGSWTADLQSPDGGTMQLAYTFKQDGAALTGTVLGPQGDPLAISDGKVDGNKITFKISFNGIILTHEGTISDSGDEIKLSSKADSGDFPAMQLSLKKAKAAKPPATQ